MCRSFDLAYRPHYSVFVVKMHILYDEKLRPILSNSSGVSQAIFKCLYLYIMRGNAVYVSGDSQYTYWQVLMHRSRKQK